MKTKLSLIIIFLATASVAGKLHAQEMMTPSALPSASSMGLVSAVNHTTGTVNVSVPLLDFESNGIHVPIGLSYNTSGIRVEDRPTEMGYGWRLSAGGRITRVVKRLPDDISLATQKWALSYRGVWDEYYSGTDLIAILNTKTITRLTGSRIYSIMRFQANRGCSFWTATTSLTLSLIKATLRSRS